MIIDTNKMLGTNRYQTIRILFIIGYILNIILTFVPSVSYKSYSYYESAEKYMSDYEAIQILLNAQSFWGIYFVVLFASYFAFIILAFKYQRSWVFITGASVTAFTFILFLFYPSNPDVHRVFLTSVLGYLAMIFILSGFFAKPPKSEQDVAK